MARCYFHDPKQFSKLFTDQNLRYSTAEDRSFRLPLEAPKMSPETTKEIQLEIGHVSFIDIVGYYKLLVNEQSKQSALRKLAQSDATK
jgi:hypothetical protein